MPSRSLRQFAAQVLSVCALTSTLAFSAPATAAGANLAMIAEPQTLDPMGSTADLVGTIMQHVYEPLYTFDAQWNVVPMLADGMPKVSKDGLTHTIALR